MKAFLLLSSLALLATSSPVPHPQATPQPLPRVTFRLRADPLNGAVARLGFLDAKGPTWPTPGERTKDYRAFYDEEHKTVNSTDGGILWLRPTHGTPMYYVFNGDPFSDPTPALTLYHWEFETANGRQYLKGESFMACGTSPGAFETKYPYFGPSTVSRCTTNFKLEIVWDITPGPEPTETATTTVTETTTTSITESTTCTTDEPEPTPTETTTTTTDLPDCPTDTTTLVPPTSTEKPTETTTLIPPTSTETEVPTEPTSTFTLIPTGTGIPPPPATNGTVTVPPPVPTETDVPELPESGARAVKGPAAGVFALVVAAGMAVFVL